MRLLAAALLLALACGLALGQSRPPDVILEDDQPQDGVTQCDSTQDWKVLVLETNDTWYCDFTASPEVWVKISASGGVTDHGGLTGLLDDDHTQYLLRTDIETSDDLRALLSNETGTGLAVFRKNPYIKDLHIINDVEDMSWLFETTEAATYGNLWIQPTDDSWIAIGGTTADVGAMLSVAYQGSPQLQLTYDSTNRAEFEVESDGDLTLNLNAGSAIFDLGSEDMALTDLTAAGTVQAEHLYTTDDLVVDDDATITGNLDVTGLFDNENTGSKILLGRSDVLNQSTEQWVLSYSRNQLAMIGQDPEVTFDCDDGDITVGACDGPFDTNAKGSILNATATTDTAIIIAYDEDGFDQWDVWSSTTAWFFYMNFRAGSYTYAADVTVEALYTNCDGSNCNTLTACGGIGGANWQTVATITDDEDSSRLATLDFSSPQMQSPYNLFAFRITMTDWNEADGAKDSYITDIVFGHLNETAFPQYLPRYNYGDRFRMMDDICWADADGSECIGWDGDEWTYSNIAANEVYVGNGSGTGEFTAIPDCDGADDTLNYDAATQTWSCGTDGGGTEANDLETAMTGVALYEIVYGAGTDQGIYSKISALTEDTGPGAGDWLLGENSSGYIRKYDVTEVQGLAVNPAACTFDAVDREFSCYRDMDQDGTSTCLQPFTDFTGTELGGLITTATDGTDALKTDIWIRSTGDGQLVFEDGSDNTTLNVGIDEPGGGVVNGVVRMESTTVGDELYLENLTGPIYMDTCDSPHMCGSTDDDIHMWGDVEIGQSSYTRDLNVWGIGNFVGGVTCGYGGDCFFESTSDLTEDGFNLDVSEATHTGDLFVLEDEGTTIWTLNSSGNMQAADDMRWFNANGLDESTYNDTWGSNVFVDTHDGALSGTYAGNLRTELKVQPSSGTGWSRNAIWVTGTYQPTSTGTSGHITGGYYEVNDGSSTAGTVTSMYGQKNFVQTVGSAATTVSNMYGAGYYFGFTGTNTTVTAATGARFWVSGSLGSGTTVANLYGIRIEDLQGHGTTKNLAIRVDAQSGDDGSEGNIEMFGDDYNEGHFVTGGFNIFGTSDGLRVENGAPTSNTDGERLDSPHSSNHGKMFWGSSDTSADTGDEVCALYGLTCQNTFEFGSSSGIACSTTHSVNYAALCY